MDGTRFDYLLRCIAQSHSRRAAVRALLGAPLGLVGAATVGAKKRKKKSKAKRKKKTKRCKAQPVSQTCAGKCGSVLDNCGSSLSCSCPTGQCCTRQGTCGACLTFNSSTHKNANFGGLNGADAVCQTLARAAGLPGTYKAWLSDTTGSPSTRFVRATAPYVLVDGTVVATSWADLVDGNLAHEINLTETGQVSTRQAWTNTKADGTLGSVRSVAPSGGLHCLDWKSDFSDDWGYLGIPHESARDLKWTDFEERPCSSTDYGLYCFQQR